MNDQQPLAIRRLEQSDLPAILSIIRDVREEYGMKHRVQSVLEPSDYALFELYRRRRAAYFVAIAGAEIVGGAGIAPLAHSDGLTCELQRMYLRLQSRGRGIGRMLIGACTNVAHSLGFARCYAETISPMTQAISLYEKGGFRRLDAPFGATGHGHNDCWLLLDLPRVTESL